MTVARLIAFIVVSGDYRRAEYGGGRSPGAVAVAVAAAGHCHHRKQGDHGQQADRHSQHLFHSGFPFHRADRFSIVRPASFPNLLII